MGLNQHREIYAQAFVETGNQSESYRRAYPKSVNWKPETVWKRASELMQDGAVLGRIEELKAAAAKRHAVTVDSLIAELEEARAIALQADTPQTSAAVSATMGKAKLCGLDKQVLEHTGEIKAITRIETVIVRPENTNR